MDRLRRDSPDLPAKTAIGGLGGDRGSSVANRTIGQFAPADMIMVQQCLRRRRVLRPVPLRIEYPARGSKLRTRISVAVEAKCHCQLRLLITKWHLIDRPVTGGASDTLGDVDAVIEIHVVRNTVHDP